MSAALAPLDMSRLPDYLQAREPALRFGPAVSRQTHRNPLLGLKEFGPYSGLYEAAPVRVATISVPGQEGILRTFIGSLQRPVAPSDRHQYVPEFPGFEALFGSALLPARHVTIDGDAHQTGGDPQASIARAISRGLQQLLEHRNEWDLVVVLLPTYWEPWRDSLDGKFKLHDRLKALAAPLGVPTQFLRESSALQTRQQGSLAWRLSIALFAKAGGTPWRLDESRGSDTAFIGLSYAIRGGSTDRFVSCCSQVFDGQGGGLEFVAYSVGEELDGDNPHLSQEDMRTVMARSADLYRRRHGGVSPKRLVVHNRYGWRDDEIAGVFDAWSTVPDIELLTIQRSPWRAVEVWKDRGPLGMKSSTYPLARGTFQQFSGTAGLIWTTGVTKGVALDGRRYNHAVKGLPAPLRLERWAGRGDFQQTIDDVLALTKLDWNNDSAFNIEPVTLGYSQKLADVISNSPDLPDNIYPYRFFI